jgi:hypothetical protein
MMERAGVVKTCPEGADERDGSNTFQGVSEQ